MRWHALAACVLGALVLTSPSAAKEPPYWESLGNFIGFGMACNVIKDRQKMYRDCFEKAARSLGWEIDDAYVRSVLGQMDLMSDDGRFDNQPSICASVDSAKDNLIAFDRLVERCGN